MQQDDLLGRFSVKTLPEVAIGSVEEVIDTLESCPLENWTERTEALATKFSNLRMEAARLLEPEVQYIALPKCTLKNEEELAAWLAEVEATLRNGLNDGPVMV